MLRRVGVLAALFLISTTAFLMLDPVGSWEFLLPFRLRRLAALMLTGVCLATATVLFQTISGNRILTPSVIGFDALSFRLLDQ